MKKAKQTSRRAPLTPYGRWVMGRIIDTGLSVNELAERIGVFPQNLSRMLHGAAFGASYKPRIERVFGKPPRGIQ